jgi:hypothetical protein
MSGLKAVMMSKKRPEVSQASLISPALKAQLRARMAAEQGASELPEYIAKRIADSVGQNSSTPYINSYVLNPMSSLVPRVAPLAALQSAALAKAMPGPDPRMERVPLSNGVYRLPPPDSLPIGARFTAPVSQYVPIQSEGRPTVFERVAEGYRLA